MAGLGTQKNPLILRVKTIDKAQRLVALCEEHGWQVIVGVEPDIIEDTSDLERKLNPPTVVHSFSKVGRNDPCPCGSGKKFKKCCADLQHSAHP